MADNEPTYDEQLTELVNSGADRPTIKQFLESHNDGVIDLETAPKQVHRWIDRGLKLSCEGAGHLYHQVWKQKK